MREKSSVFSQPKIFCINFAIICPLKHEKVVLYNREELELTICLQKPCDEFGTNGVYISEGIFFCYLQDKELIILNNIFRICPSRYKNGDYFIRNLASDTFS